MQVDPAEALILIHMDFYIHFYITKMVRQIDTRQSFLKEFKSVRSLSPPILLMVLDLEQSQSTTVSKRKEAPFGMC